MANRKNLNPLTGIFAVAFMAVVFTNCPQADNPVVQGQFTVKFNSNGGSAVASQTIVRGGKIIKPQDPVKQDLILGGWYKDTQLNTRWFFDAELVTRDITLNARWVYADADDVYTLQFDSGEGGSLIDPVLYLKGGEVVPVNLYVPSRAGYEFQGWFIDYGADPPILQQLTVTGNTTLKARWLNKTAGGGETGAYQPANPNDVLMTFRMMREELGQDAFGNNLYGSYIKGADGKFIPDPRGIHWDENAQVNMSASLLDGAVEGPWGKAQFPDGTPAPINSGEFIEGLIESNWNSYTGLNWLGNGSIKVKDNRNKQISRKVDSEAVFEFYTHENRDLDKKNTGRQRIEIRGDHPLVEGSLAVTEDDIVTYSWKFWLPADLVVEPPAGFFHIFQTKAIEGPEAGAPITCFTVQAGQLVFRNISIGAHMDTTEVVASVPIEKVLDRWLAAEVTMHFRDDSAGFGAPIDPDDPKGITSTEPALRDPLGNVIKNFGHLYVKLTDLDNGVKLMEATKACDMWRRPEVRNAGGIWEETDLDAAAAQYVRPKWGLYRAINARSRTSTMQWADLVMIKRDKAAYRFPLDNHDPNSIGPIPKRDNSTYPAFENATAENWQLTTKSSISHYEKDNVPPVINILNKDNLSNGVWMMHRNIINSAPSGQETTATRGQIPIWMAVDMGEKRRVNEIQIHFSSSSDSASADLFDNFYIAVTDSEAAWNALKSNPTDFARLDEAVTAGVLPGSATLSELTTLDPLGLHTTDGKYYTGSNPYQYAGSWSKFVELPKISRDSSDPSGLQKNWSTDEVFNRLRSTGGMDLAKPYVEGRYIIWYSDPCYMHRKQPSVWLPQEIRYRTWVIKDDPRLYSQGIIDDDE